MADLAATIGLAPVKPPTGAWFVYDVDTCAFPLSLFDDELMARRWADQHGYGRVVFWPFGREWEEICRG